MDFFYDLINIERPEYVNICGQKILNLYIANQYDNILKYGDKREVDYESEDKKIDLDFYINFKHTSFNEEELISYILQITELFKDPRRLEEIMTEFISMIHEVNKYWSIQNIMKKFKKKHNTSYLSNSSGVFNISNDKNIPFYSILNQQVDILFVAHKTEILDSLSTNIDINKIYLNRQGEFISYLSKDLLNYKIANRLLNIDINEVYKSLDNINCAEISKLYIQLFIIEIKEHIKSNYKIYINYLDCKCKEADCLCKIRVDGLTIKEIYTGLMSMHKSVSDIITFVKDGKIYIQNRDINIKPRKLLNDIYLITIKKYHTFKTIIRHVIMLNEMKIKLESPNIFKNNHLHDIYAEEE